MKRLLPTLFLFATLLSVKPASAQYGVQIPVLIPSGNYYPYLLKPGYGIELDTKLGYIDDKVRFGMSLGYYKFNPTQDTFQTYGVGGNPVMLLPGYEVIHSYSIIQVGPTCDIKILDHKKVSPFFGIDLFADIFDISHDDYTESLILSSTTNDIYYNWALDGRVGVQYQLNDDMLLMAGLGRHMGFGGAIGRQAFWKPFISFIYYSN